MSKKYGDIETHIYSKSLNVHCIVYVVSAWPECRQIISRKCIQQTQTPAVTICLRSELNQERNRLTGVSKTMYNLLVCNIHQIERAIGIEENSDSTDTITILVDVLVCGSSRISELKTKT